MSLAPFGCGWLLSRAWRRTIAAVVAVLSGLTGRGHGLPWNGNILAGLEVGQHPRLVRRSAIGNPGNSPIVVDESQQAAEFLAALLARCSEAEEALGNGLVLRRSADVGDLKRRCFHAAWG